MDYRRVGIRSLNWVYKRHGETKTFISRLLPVSMECYSARPNDSILYRAEIFVTYYMDCFTDGVTIYNPRV